ncbi:DUF4350 domain-containing protein [Brevundimonas sp. NPDC092305]|uniref:DUF4350 domain-containing protein n=1 Tax=Brevundimonas sp. NPDC092305 TaxID=3363957 RepID=UPI0037F17B34
MTEAVSSKAQAVFRPVVVIALVLAAVFALSGIGVLGAFAPELDKGDDGRAHALSKSAIGYAGVVRLLKDTGKTVVLSRGFRTGYSDTLVILAPPPEADRKMLDAARQGPDATLIILPKWQAMGDPRHRGWVGPVAQIGSKDVLTALPEDLRKDLTLTTTPGRSVPQLQRNGGFTPGAPVEGLRTLSGPGWNPVIEDGSRRAILAYHEDTGIYVLSDPDLLNTRGLNDAAKARTALAVIDAIVPGDSVVFDLSLNGFGRPRSVLRLLLEPPLLGFTLCLLAAVALVGWQAAVRFAPHRHTRRAVALGKKALADNTAALVRLARREKSMAAPYAELMRGQAAKAVSAPPNLSREALTALLDRLAARQGATTSYDALAAEADKASNANDLMTVARALNTWKSEMTRGRG